MKAPAYDEVDTQLTDEQVKQKLEEMLAARASESQMQTVAPPPVPVAMPTQSPLDNLLQEEALPEELPMDQAQAQQSDPTGPQVGPSRVDYEIQSAFKPELRDPELKKLLEAQRNTMNETGFQRAAQGLIQTAANKERITRGDAPTYNTDPYGILEEQEKRAAQPLKDLAARRGAEVQDISTQKDLLKKQETQEDFDPSSPRSKLFQQAAKKIGLDQYLGDALDKMSANALEKFLPFELKMQAIEADKELAKARMQDSKEDKNLRRQDQEDQRTEKSFEKLSERLDPSRTIRGNLGEQNRVAMRANAGLELVGSKPFKDITDIEMKELARTLEGVLSGGVGTIQGAKALVPKTAQGSIKDALQWVSNKPQGKDQAEFVGLLTKALSRQKEVAEGNIKKMQSEILRTAAPKLKQKDPERWGMFLDELGLDENAKPKDMPKQSSPSKSSAPSAVASDKVTVRDKSGRRFALPKSQLEAAKKQGYTVE